MNEEIIFSLDSGYGMDKFAKRNENGKLVFGKITSAIAEAPLDAEDMPLFEGKRFYMGDIALMEDSSNIKNILDYKDHETFAPISIWHALDENNIKPESIKCLAVGLSLAQKDYAKQFVNRISKFTVSGQKFDFKDKITLVPQGIGAKFAIDDFYYKEADKAPTYAIIDIGQLSVDLATVINGKVRRENASGTTHDGVIKIIQELQEYIAQEENFGDMLSIKEVQEVLKENKYISYGETHDLSEVINKLKKSYTKYLIRMLQDRHNNIFKKYSTIYFVGGGSYYIDLNEIENLTKISSKSFVIPKNPEYLNAIGYLIAAEKSMSN